MVSGGDADAPPVVTSFDAAALEQHRVVIGEDGGQGARRLVGSGRAAPGVEVKIVDPENAAPSEAGRVGEIWVAGASVAAGYWRQSEKTAEDFEARLEPDGPCYLRTGDLGFLDGEELYITGRLKDLIILRGRNHYPQDIERTAETSHRGLRPGCGAAFSIEVDSEERLVVVHEVDRHPGAEPEVIAEAVRRAVAEEHEVQVHEVVLVRAGSIAKTSSGKIRRGACRAEYSGDALRAVTRSALTEDEAAELVGGELELDRRTLIARPAEQRRELLLTWLKDRFRAPRPAAGVTPGRGGTPDQSGTRLPRRHRARRRGRDPARPEPAPGRAPRRPESRGSGDASGFGRRG